MSGLPTTSSASAWIGSATSRRRSQPAAAACRSRFSCARTWSSPSMAAALRDAGCREVWLGAESGSQKILDAMHKGTRVAEIAQARRALGAEGIRVGFFLMLGYLGEELDDILATRDLVERTRPDDIGVSVAYPLPGTKFFDARETPARRETQLAREQRPRHDVLRHLSLGVLPQRAEPAARSRCRRSLGSRPAPVGRARERRSAVSSAARGGRCARDASRSARRP